MIYSHVFTLDPAEARSPAARMFLCRFRRPGTGRPRKMPRYLAVPPGLSLLTGQGAFRKLAKSQKRTG